MSGDLIVGIDLGTTHCAVAWARLADTGGGGAPAEPAATEGVSVSSIQTPRTEPPSVSDFPIQQLVQAGQTAALPLLPSNLYLAAAGEFPDGAATLPWGDTRDCVAGAWARRLGARTPGRLVASSKSWLCHPAVDRTAAFLPWGGLDKAPRISPVDAAERLLRHIAAAWDQAHPDAPLAKQDCTITVPASFDEVARALTVEAAHRAGIERPFLLEEPQAAFYDFAWTHRTTLAEKLAGARLILVIDVGGGTTDLSLIQARPGADEPELRRIAVGEHLMLGGDNMDIALARLAEARMIAGGRKLSAIQWSQLVHAAREAKETLLTAQAAERHGLAVAGEGSRLIGATLSCELSRDEARACVLDGFFPACPPDAELRRGTRAALQELGLPYAQDPVITRQIAAFLRRHAALAREALGTTAAAGTPGAEPPETLPRPDAVLLNGGVFNSPLIVERLQSVLASWWPEQGAPRLLPHSSLDLAVARGAVARGLARHGHMRSIEGGAAHAYHIGVAGAKDAPPRVVCVLPRGQAEGTTIELKELPFDLRLNEPVRFPLYSGTDDRPAAAGQLREQGDDLEALPPLQTVLKSADASADTESVYLTCQLTEVGTLELWCVARRTGERWKLEFALRNHTPEEASPPGTAADAAAAGTPTNGGAAAGSATGAPPKEALALLDRFFAKGAATPSPKDFKMAFRALEEHLGPRETWGLPLLRALWDQLQERAPQRRRSAAHERLYFQLAGYSLRPGFGHPLDAWRGEQSLKLLEAGLAHGAEQAGWNEYWIHWRRIAGGLGQTGQARLWELLKPHLARRVPPHPPKHLPRPKGVAFEGLEEMVRAAASLEQLAVEEKTLFGGWIAERLEETPQASGPWAWALGRLGARSPLHGSLHRVVPIETASAWLELILRLGLGRVDGAPFAAAQLARLTGDRGRDIDDALRTRVLAALDAEKASERLRRLVAEQIELDAAEEAKALGDTLPIGLHLSDEPRES